MSALPFRRVAPLIAVLYLCGAGALFVAMFAADRYDDYAGWVPAIVFVQVVWCAALGRPTPDFGGGRAMFIRGSATTLVIVTILAAIGAGLEALDPRWLLLPIAAALAPVLALIGRMRSRRPMTSSTARLAAQQLLSITLAAIGSGAIAAVCVRIAARRDEFLGGLVSGLALFADLLVLGFTLGPWLWLLAVRLPPREPIPVARARRA